MANVPVARAFAVCAGAGVVDAFVGHGYLRDCGLWGWKVGNGKERFRGLEELALVRVEVP
jgi:hypothetical protein